MHIPTKMERLSIMHAAPSTIQKIQTLGKWRTHRAAIENKLISISFRFRVAIIQHSVPAMPHWVCSAISWASQIYKICSSTTTYWRNWKCRSVSWIPNSRCKPYAIWALHQTHRSHCRKAVASAATVRRVRLPRIYRPHRQCHRTVSHSRRPRHRIQKMVIIFLFSFGDSPQNFTEIHLNCSRLVRSRISFLFFFLLR